ncbi:factor of DNA methylation 4 isoform X2 [Jatropha curcas]|uniref:factor of DNA methylation 4 isoform X2 n=1 Tax=Jatropha curcas TaxID=180498 RepID=UPI0009D74806|nr:factor of DNA methylation 4 isoform X2 [Jatropha curcas]
MTSTSRRERDTSNSKLEDYKYRYYNELKRGRIDVKISNSGYRCPYCHRRRGDYLFEELLQHAYHLGRDIQRIDLKGRAQHLALEKYINRYMNVKENSKQASKTEFYGNEKRDTAQFFVSPTVLDHEKDGKIPSSKHDQKYMNRYMNVKEELKQASKTEFHGNQKHDVAQLFVSPTVHNHEKDEKIPPSKHDHGKDQLFVWPCVGIVANIQTRLINGRHVAESGSKLRDELTRKGFDPVRVHPLWNHLGHSGFAIVDFKNGWDGFKNAIMFEKDFEVNHCGKEDYCNLPQWHRGDRLYGWVARDADYYSRGVIGGHLRKYGDLKSVSGQEAEDRRKDSKLVTTLTNTLLIKNECLREMEIKVNETNVSLNKVIEEKDAIITSFNEEMRRMQQIAHDHFEKIYIEHKRATLDLEAQRKELEQREKQLQKREFQNENERRKFHHVKKMNERAIVEQKKADEKVFRLAEEQKRQKEKLHKKIIELEKKLDAKQALELEIEQMKGTLQVMKHMGEDEDMEVKKKMDVIREELKEKEEELDAMETLNQTLIVKERMNNDELQDARKELMTGLGEDTRAFIHVKKMGELDGRPFHTAAKRKFSDEEADMKAGELCSLWDHCLRDPGWHPFKIITDKEGHSEGLVELVFLKVSHCLAWTVCYSSISSHNLFFSISFPHLNKKFCITLSLIWQTTFQSSCLTFLGRYSMKMMKS